MHTVTLADAKAHLDELMDHLQAGEAILMMDQGRPLAHVRKAERDSWTCKAGSAVRKIHMAPDFGTATPPDRSFRDGGSAGSCATLEPRHSTLVTSEDSSSPPLTPPFVKGCEDMVAI